MHRMSPGPQLSPLTGGLKKGSVAGCPLRAPNLAGFSAYQQRHNDETSSLLIKCIQSADMSQNAPSAGLFYEKALQKLLQNEMKAKQSELGGSQGLGSRSLSL